MTKIIVVIGPGSIGQAIARRVGAGKHVLLCRPSHAEPEYQDAAQALNDRRTRPMAIAPVALCPGLSNNALGRSVPCAVQRESLCVLKAQGNALTLNTLRFASEIRPVNELRLPVNENWSPTKSILP
jgi:NAD(P)-dependent dehydrogenase (short-subunit alcohol dehydrogenase family)